jgi:antitoxin ParD1/3/4
MPNVSLTPAMEQELEEAVASGEYTSVSEIVREGLRLWRERRTQGQFYQEWLAAQIEIGWDQADRGELEGHDMKSIIESAGSKAAR